MNERTLLEHLEHTAMKLGVTVRYENLTLHVGRSQGGYCKLEGNPLIIVDKRESHRKKISVIAKALGHLDTDHMFIPPAIRRIIDSHKS
jgi:hypothetical protein